MELNLAALIVVHTSLSFVAMMFGILLIHEFIHRIARPTVSAGYFITSVAATMTGFAFPLHPILPPHILGVLSLLALAVALVTRFHSARESFLGQCIYRVSTVISVSFLFFAAVAELFIKSSLLHALAPTLTEAPFWSVEGGVLLLFGLSAYVSVARRQPRAVLA
jgi:hypothetical protein